MPSTHYPSLFLVVNTEQARWVRVEDHQKAEELEFLKEPYSPPTDREGRFKTRGKGKTMRSGEPDTVQPKKEEHLRQHIRHVAEKTNILSKKEKFMSYACAAPEELKHIVTEELKRCGIKNVHIIYGNYMRRPVSTIPDLFLKSIRPQ